MATRKTSSGKKKASKRYGKKAGDKVKRSMEEMKSGTLRSGGSGKKVTSRKQAIAIGLSEARAAGGKVPPSPRKKTAKKGSKKTAKKGSKKGAKKRARR